MQPFLLSIICASMGNYFLVIVSTFFFMNCNVIAQNLNFDVSEAGIGANGVVRFNDPSLMTEKSGVKIDYSDVRGNCFLNKEWMPALIKLKSGSSVKFSNCKFNLMTSDIHYLNNEGVELVAESKIVNLIFLFDQRDTTKIVSTLKQIRQDGQESFFQFMNNGKIVLLKKSVVSLFKGDYDLSRAKNDFRFVRKDDYFILESKTINSLTNLNKESLSKYLPINRASVDWLKTNKNKLKDEIQIVNFLNYYNATVVQ